MEPYQYLHQHLASLFPTVPIFLYQEPVNPPKIRVLIQPHNHQTTSIKLSGRANNQTETITITITSNSYVGAYRLAKDISKQVQQYTPDNGNLSLSPYTPLPFNNPKPVLQKEGRLWESQLMFQTQYRGQ